MNCEQFEELAGAYALGALTPEETREAERHLAGCERHAEARELVAVAAGLAAAAPEMEPPPALKARLMNDIHGGLPPERSRDTASGRGIVDMIRALLAGPRLGYALSGALAIVVAGLLAWNISLQSDGDGGGAGQLVVDLSGAASGEMIYLEEQDIAFFDLEGLDPAPQGQTYQMWAISDGAPVSIGLLGVDETGRARATTSFDLEGVDTIAVTLEPEGGSPLPTSDPIITGDV
jgi:anti-sigma-K factor RskA